MMILRERTGFHPSLSILDRGLARHSHRVWRAFSSLGGRRPFELWAVIDDGLEPTGPGDQELVGDAAEDPKPPAKGGAETHLAFTP